MNEDSDSYLEPNKVRPYSYHVDIDIEEEHVYAEIHSTKEPKGSRRPRRSSGRFGSLLEMDSLVEMRPRTDRRRSRSQESRRSGAERRRSKVFEEVETEDGKRTSRVIYKVEHRDEVGKSRISLVEERTRVQVLASHLSLSWPSLQGEDSFPTPQRKTTPCRFSRTFSAVSRNQAVVAVVIFLLLIGAVAVGSWLLLVESQEYELEKDELSLETIQTSTTSHTII